MMPDTEQIFSKQWLFSLSKDTLSGFMVFIYRTSSSALDCMHCSFGGLMHSLYLWIVNSESRCRVWLFVTTYSPWVSLGQNTGVGSLSLLQRIFPTQGSNPGLLHCGWILYQLSHNGSPRILEWVAYPFSSGSFGFCHHTLVAFTEIRFFILWISMSNKFFVLKTVIP